MCRGIAFCSAGYALVGNGDVLVIINANTKAPRTNAIPTPTPQRHCVVSDEQQQLRLLRRQRRVEGHWCCRRRLSRPDLAFASICTFEGDRHHLLRMIQENAAILYILYDAALPFVGVMKHPEGGTANPGTKKHAEVNSLPGGGQQLGQPLIRRGRF